jgi:hypothetical protein
MLSEHDIKTGLEILKHAHKKAAESCDTWRDSGDRGACYAYTVQPVARLIEFFEQTLEDLKAEENAKDS